MTLIKFVLLYFLVQILAFWGIVASSPILKYGAQYAQMVSRVNSCKPCPHQSRTPLSFADSSDSSSRSWTSLCLFQRVPGQQLKRWPKLRLRQTHHVLAVKAPHFPSAIATQPSPRASAGATPLTFVQSPWTDSQPRPKSTSAMFTASPLGPNSVLPGRTFPEITTEHPSLVPSTTIREPRGDA